MQTIRLATGKDAGWTFKAREDSDYQEPFRTGAFWSWSASNSRLSEWLARRMWQMWNCSKSHYLRCESLLTIVFIYGWVCHQCSFWFTLKQTLIHIMIEFSWQLRIFLQPHTLKKFIFNIFHVASSRRYCTSDYGRSGGSRSCDKIDEWPNVWWAEISCWDVGRQDKVQVSNKLITTMIYYYQCRKIGSMNQTRLARKDLASGTSSWKRARRKKRLEGNQRAAKVKLKQAKIWGIIVKRIMVWLWDK